MAPLWWLNWPPRTISSGYLGRPQRWPLLPLSSTNISTTQEVSQIGKWAAGCRRRHLHLPTFAPLQLLFCLTRRPAPAAFLLLITVSSVFPLSPAACLAPTPVSNLGTLNWNIVCLADRLTLSQHNTPLTQTEHSLLFYKHYLQARPRNQDRYRFLEFIVDCSFWLYITYLHTFIQYTLSSHWSN